MSSETPDPAPVAGKALVYYRTNYLFGVARPGALVVDGATVSCLDNQLATVFSAPRSSVVITKGFGIFKVHVDGTRVSFLTPVGGTTSPEPSEALLGYLRRSTESPSATEVGSSLAAGAGSMVGGAVGGALSAAADAVDQVVAVAGYVSGMKGLGAFLASAGLLAR